ncbi:fimbrial biogenesis chaperone [Morganella morganii]|uniref:fimbrial biogenesis chaperone n=1 Tax=Morganella morganii TaxID=582 RepID=UPI00046A2AB3|nr:molecular chaperone [Morganella morganii]
MTTVTLRQFFWAPWLLSLLGVQGTLPANAQPQKGLQLSVMRVIYPEKAVQGITFAVTNNAPESYLIQSRVTPWDAKTSDDTTLASPFIVTPPLKRLDAGETSTLRIRKTQKALPTDRESVFGFHVKGIPGQPLPSVADKASKATLPKQNVKMVFALQYTLKLFYRPSELPPYDAVQVAKALQFSYHDKKLVVKNPSAFYVTFDTLAFAAHEIDGDALFDMVPPFGQRTYPLPASDAQGMLTWRIITDIGGKTEPLTRMLSSSASLIQKQQGE